jgi:hypothetical protein
MEELNMDFINESIAWLEANWGVAVFGTVSLGSVASVTVLMVKQWIANKVQGTKYENLFNQSQAGISTMKKLYEEEKAKNGQVNVQNIFMQQSQAVLMDAIIKMALSSKLDSDDKTAIVANVERLKLLTPTEIVNTVKEDASTISTNVQEELNENPAQTVYNITEGVTSLLDKYTKKE